MNILKSLTLPIKSPDGDFKTYAIGTNNIIKTDIQWNSHRLDSKDTTNTILKDTSKIVPGDVVYNLFKKSEILNNCTGVLTIDFNAPVAVGYQKSGSVTAVTDGNYNYNQIIRIEFINGTITQARAYLPIPSLTEEISYTKSIQTSENIEECLAIKVNYRNPYSSIVQKSNQIIATAAASNNITGYSIVGQIPGGYPEEIKITWQGETEFLNVSSPSTVPTTYIQDYDSIISLSYSPLLIYGNEDIPKINVPAGSLYITTN